jgi:hypothetical protein
MSTGELSSANGGDLVDGHQLCTFQPSDVGMVTGSVEVYLIFYSKSFQLERY